MGRPIRREGAILDIILVLALTAACLWIAVRSYANPSGVYRRSLVGIVLTIAAALAIWFLASPLISNAAGLGALFLFLIVAVTALGMGAVACVAATVRHLRNAFGA